MIHFLVPAADEFGIREYLGLWGLEVARRTQVYHYEDLLERASFGSGAYVFAGLDRLRPQGLALMAALRRQLLATGPGVRALNAPGETLLRYQLLEELHRGGLNPHRAVRATEDYQRLRYPVFLREEHGHDGALTPLLHSPKELEAALAKALLRGAELDDLLVVEFCDTADTKGAYRKYAAFIVGSEVIPRALAYGDAWMLKHAQTRFSAGLLREEEAYVVGNPHEAELRAIFSLARVEYGRIDYALCDGKIVTWEINLNPTIGRGSRAGSRAIPEALRPLRQTTREHFYRRLQEAFEAIDLPGRGVEIPVARSSLRPAEVVRTQRPSPARSALARLLRPVLPLVERVAPGVFPLVVRVARARAGRSARRAG